VNLAKLFHVDSRRLYQVKGKQD
jgi:hypothetical protein